MKKFFIGVLIGLFSVATANAATYYTCSSPSGTDLTTDASGGGTCNVGIGTWNVAGNIVIVRTGTTLTLTADPFDLNCVIDVQENGTLLYDSGNGASFNILANSVLIVNGLFEIDDNNVALNINSNGLLLVNSTGTVRSNGSANNDIIVNGDITGSGSIEWTGSASGSGTINGIPIGGQTSPLDISDVGLIWDGTSWSPSAPMDTIDRAIFTGNYSSTADALVSATWPSDAFTIDPGVTVSFDDNDNLGLIVSAKIDGVLELVDNVTINSLVFADPASTGQVKITRNFTTQGWKHFGLPLSTTSTATLGDIVTSGLTFNYTNPISNQTNIYYWDAGSASWLVPAAADLITGKAFNVFSPGTGSISITRSIFELINNLIVQSYTYFDPGATSAPVNGIGWTDAITDGWNMWTNPYQSYLESDNLALPADLVGGVYVWNGTQYLTRNGGSGAAEFIGPHQAFFVRTDGASNAFAIPESARNFAPSSTPNYFKTSNELVFNLSGQGVNTNTYVVQNALATKSFDNSYDANYFFGAQTVFNSVGEDSAAYSVNQLPSLSGEELYLSFYHQANNKAFTISLDPASNSPVGDIMLEDLYTGAIVNLMANDYTFASNSSAPVQRFKILFSQNSVGIQEIEEGIFTKLWFNEDVLQIDEKALENIEHVSVFNISGQLVAQSSDIENIVVNETGVFIVNLSLKGNISRTVKLVKM